MWSAISSVRIARRMASICAQVWKAARFNPLPVRLDRLASWRRRCLAEMADELKSAPASGNLRWSTNDRQQLLGSNSEDMIIYSPTDHPHPANKCPSQSHGSRNAQASPWLGNRFQRQEIRSSSEQGRSNGT